MYKCNMALCACAMCICLCVCARSCLCRIAVMERVWHVAQQRTTKYITHFHKRQRVDTQCACTRECKPRKYHGVIPWALVTFTLLLFLQLSLSVSLWLYLLLLHSYTHSSTHMIRLLALPCDPCQQFNVIEIIVSVHSFGYSFFRRCCDDCVGRISLVHSQLLSLAIYIFFHQIIFSLFYNILCYIQIIFFFSTVRWWWWCFVTIKVVCSSFASEFRALRIDEVHID